MLQRNDQPNLFVLANGMSVECLLSLYAPGVDALYSILCVVHKMHKASMCSLDPSALPKIQWL